MGKKSAFSCEDLLCTRNTRIITVKVVYQNDNDGFIFGHTNHGQGVRHRRGKYKGETERTHSLDTTLNKKIRKKKDY